jgi:hypothetical protein
MGFFVFVKDWIFLILYFFLFWFDWFLGAEEFDEFRRDA